jgi:hypothetical protein
VCFVPGENMVIELMAAFYQRLFNVDHDHLARALALPEQTLEGNHACFLSARYLSRPPPRLRCSRSCSTTTSSLNLQSSTAATTSTLQWRSQLQNERPKLSANMTPATSRRLQTDTSLQSAPKQHPHVAASACGGGSFASWTFLKS